MTGRVRSSSIIVGEDDIMASFKNLDNISWTSLIRYLSSTKLAEYSVQHPYF